MLNNVFVSGLPGLVDLPVHPHHSGHVLISTSVLWSAALVSMVGASCLPKLFCSSKASLSLLQFIFKNLLVSSVNDIPQTGI